MFFIYIYCKFFSQKESLLTYLRTSYTCTYPLTSSFPFLTTIILVFFGSYSEFFNVSCVHFLIFLIFLISSEFPTADIMSPTGSDWGIPMSVSNNVPITCNTTDFLSNVATVPTFYLTSFTPIVLEQHITSPYVVYLADLHYGKMRLVFPVQIL